MRLTLWMLGFAAIWMLASTTGCGCTGTPQNEKTAEQAVEKDATEKSAEQNIEGASDASEEQQPEQQATENPLGDLLPEGPISPKDLCRALGESLCTEVMRCCADRGIRFANQAACSQEFASLCEQGTSAALSSALQAGQAVIVRSLVESCIQLQAKAGERCGIADGNNARLVCGAVFQSTAKIGEACADGLGGIPCDGNQGVCFPDPLGTTCKAWGKEGDSCAAAPCAPHLFCFSSPTNPVGTCEAPATEGQMCSFSAQCRAGFFCLEQRCTAQRTEGSACQSSEECNEETACSPSTMQCIPRIALDQPCSFPAACSADLLCHPVEKNMARCVPSICRDFLSETP
jgi:hypothetical protein